MDGTLDEWTQPTVDPEVRAYVSSLVTALGGTSIEEHGRYVLGDDALACLKDLRRWLKLYDEKLNRLDVQRILAESNLVKGDLLEILASWPETATENKLKFKVALACLELLVPITWPTEIDDELMKVNHHRHLPYLRLAKVEYKRAILHHDIAKILRTVVRIGLPSMAIAKNDRASRDEGIIRLVLYFIRNVAMIEQPKDLPSDGDEAEVARSATIDAFHYQDVLQLLLTLCSSMGDEFVVQDVVVLEVLFHLLKGINPEKLFMEEQQASQASADEFKEMMQKEKAMLAGYKRHAPTRHNRFGTMVWIKRDNEKVTTVTGQEVLAGTDRAIRHMDRTKKWNKPKFRAKQNLEDKESSDFNKSVSLSPSARKHLRRFVEDFLDSSFNPLITHLRKAIEREAERVLQETHPMQFFYLISWFLQAECARRRNQKERKAAKSKTKEGTAAANDEDESFGLVASVMNQETFVLLNRYMQRAQDNKEWKELNAGLRCFTQILLTVQEMAASPIDDDQEIAENIQNRIFYEESTHDRVIAILRGYKDQGFGYLDACTELAHVFIRMLEQYSKQNVDLQIRSRRRARRKQRAAEQAEGSAMPDTNADDDTEDIAEVQVVSRERKFDFTRFVARFMTQASVNTFVALTRYHQDLSKEQLKRAHRFFHRVAFKNELSVMLFRLDIIDLFQKMIKGPGGLDSESSAFKEWEEFVRQLFRRLIKRMQDRPALFVEMLFSKIPSTVFYLEHGYDNKIERVPRPPAELEVRPAMELNQQIAVAVGVLINQNKSDALSWIKKVISEAKDERQAWQDAEIARKAIAREAIDDARSGEDGTAAISNEESNEESNASSILVKPDNEERRKALFKDNKLRLLMTLAGFQRLGDPEDVDASWIIPSAVSPEKLQETLEVINATEFAPPTYEDGKSAEDFLRSKAAGERAAERRTRQTAFDDDSDNGIDFDEEFEFPAGGPTARKSDALEELKKKRRRRNRVTDELDDEEKARKREERHLADLEKRRKIKSALFVHDSDEETDEEKDREFFAKEEERRVNMSKNIISAIDAARKKDARSGDGKKRKSTNREGGASKKRKAATSASGNETLTGEDEEVIAISSESSSSDGDSDINMEDGGNATDTPISSQPQPPSPATKNTDVPSRVVLADISIKDAGDDSDDDEPVRQPVRRRAGFVIESDSE